MSEVDPASAEGDRRRWHLVAEKGLPVFTALLGVVAAALGVWGVLVSEDRDQLDAEASTAEGEVEAVTEENHDLRRQVAELTESRDEWRDRAESAESADEGVEGSPSAPASPPPVDPAVFVSPDSITAGQDSLVLEITGEGFEPGARVELALESLSFEGGAGCLNPVDLRTVSADAEGAFATSETVYEDCVLDHPSTVALKADAAGMFPVSANIRIV